MEARLIPVNGLIGLVTRDGLNPPALADAGLELVGLEIPCVTPEGTVVIDVVLANPNTGHVVACESKCGNNIEVAQARRYMALEASTVVRSAFVTLRQRVEPTLEVVYAGPAENRDRMLLSLSEAGVPFPMISISRSVVSLERPEAASELLRSALGAPIALPAPPAGYISFDHESDIGYVRPQVRAALVAGLAQRTSMMSVTSITERAAPNYVLYSVVAQGRMRRLVAQAARDICADSGGTFEFSPARGNHEAFIRVLRSPEENDPRGRTQGYQGLARTARRPGRKRQEVPGQGSLLDELDKADGSEESVDAKQEAEE